MGPGLWSTRSNSSRRRSDLFFSQKVLLAYKSVLPGHNGSCRGVVYGRMTGQCCTAFSISCEKKSTGQVQLQDNLNNSVREPGFRQLPLSARSLKTLTCASCATSRVPIASPHSRLHVAHVVLPILRSAGRYGTTFYNMTAMLHTLVSHLARPQRL